MMFSAAERTAALAEVTRIATEAADVVMSGYRRPGGPRIDFKGEIDLVTDFDRASEDLIRRRVARSFPGCDLVAEEAGGLIRGDRPVFYADPLDGTTNFSHGHFYFAVSIALLSQGSLELGVVVAPALRITWAAARGLGATRNGEPCRVSKTEVLDRALLATGFPYDRRTSARNNFRTFVEMKKQAQGIRRCGAAAVDLCLVADGAYDGFWELKLRPWDLSAGALIVEEAGGRVSGFRGEPLDVLAGEIVATNGILHDPLVKAIADAEALPGL